MAALRVLLPWLIDRITADVKAGRQPVIPMIEIQQVLNQRKEAIRTVYRAD